MIRTRLSKKEWAAAVKMLPPDQPFSALEGFNARTIPGLLVERVLRTPDNVAMRIDNGSSYQDITWKEYLGHVEKVCFGLLDLGLEKGDRVAIMGKPCPEWLFADLAIQACGAITVGIYETDSAEQIKYLMENSEAKVFIGLENGCIDKILPLRDSLPNLKAIVRLETHESQTMSFEELENIGSRRRDATHYELRQVVSNVEPDDIALMIYTSGTTGSPKAVLLSHRSILWGRFALTIPYPYVFFNRATKALAHLSLAHILGRLDCVFFPLLGGYTIYFGKDFDKMILKVCPSELATVPRTLTKYADQLLDRVEHGNSIQKRTYRVALRIGQQYISQRWQGKVPWYLNGLYKLAHRIVFRPLLSTIGFQDLKLVIAGGAATPFDVVKWWQILGVNVSDWFGSTEAVHSIQQEAFSRPGGGGYPILREEYKLTSDGEMLVRGPDNFIGYWRNKAATDEAIVDGWVRTGDIVRVLPDGKVQFVGRIKDVIKTAGGKTISPSQVEDAFRESNYIDKVLVFGNDRKYLVALVEMKEDAVSQWAKTRGLKFDSYVNLTGLPEVQELIKHDIEKNNEKLARVEQVKYFRILPEKLASDQKLLAGANAKVRRDQVYRKYEQLIESMYPVERKDRLDIS